MTQAKSYHRDEVYLRNQELFENAKIKEKFDVVILNHVLEHLEQPEKVLQKIHSLLNKRGIIAINVPNAGSLSAKIYGASWKYVLPDEHLWQFTEKALKSLLEKNGFSVLSWEAKSGIWEFDNPILELWQSFFGIKKRFLTNIITALPTLIVTKLKLGTGLSVIAIKK